MQSYGRDITLDDVLTILDEHYNNVKALDALKSGIVPDEDGLTRRQCWTGVFTSPDTYKY